MIMMYDVIYVILLVVFDDALTRSGGRDVCWHADMPTKTTRLLAEVSQVSPSLV
jgi:hypothetical protein